MDIGDPPYDADLDDVDRSLAQRRLLIAFDPHCQFSSITGLDSLPMPLISTSTVSPAIM